MRICRRLLSVTEKVLNTPRSALKYEGPYMTGRIVAPFSPATVGNAKQLGFMYWLGPRFLRGSQVRIGVSVIFGVPRMEAALTLNVVPGIFEPFRFMPKVWPRCPVRLAPLWY